jgi:Cu2+-exporting ATPase
MFTFLLLGARYIDNRLQHRFDLSSRLLTALPETALVIRNGVETRVPTAELTIGDHLWIAAGAQIPVDGVSCSNQASVDEAVLTGESDWVSKGPGSPVFAGSYNRGAGFQMRATHAYDQSRIADIAQLADRADLGGTEIVRLTDRIAGVFVPAVLLLAALSAIAWQLVDPSKSLTAALTVLVVSCPCALSLATPAALTAAMTRLRQLGIVLTDSAVLEKIPLIDRIFIDKTGTLTMDEVNIRRVELLDPPRDEAECLAIAAALQRHSSHPYAKAFSDLPRTTTVDRVKVMTGQGVEGCHGHVPVRIGSAKYAGLDADQHRDVFLSIDGVPAARFELSDRIRPDAPASVEMLKRAGVMPLMLSGDSIDRCREAARQLEIDFEARRTPEGKLRAIRAEQARGRRVLMLGDGINDVPVLAAADVSAAVVEASDLVKSRADVLLLSRKLRPLIDLIAVGRSTRVVIRQNLIWAGLYNLTAVPIAALGLMPPWLAALGMASSSTLVMLNASRLTRQGRRES